MTTYNLSNRQKKELLERGRELYIAIPQPGQGEPVDPLSFARAALPDVAAYIVEASGGTVRVDPITRGEAGLAALLGAICADASPAWTIPALVILAHIRPPRNPRGTTPKIQWPGSVIHNGVVFP